MIKAKKMDTVKVRYTGRLAEGEVFDQSPEDRPLHFIIGKEEVIPGFEEAVEGMFQGESKTVTLPCSKAYGESRPELYETIDKSLIGNDVDLQEGGQLEITNQDGKIFHLMVREVREDEVVLDTNHPLAGKDLIFDIELIEVIKAAS